MYVSGQTLAPSVGAYNILIILFIIIYFAHSPKKMPGIYAAKFTFRAIYSWEIGQWQRQFRAV